MGLQLFSALSIIKHDGMHDLAYDMASRLKQFNKDNPSTVTGTIGDWSALPPELT